MASSSAITTRVGTDRFASLAVTGASASDGCRRAARPARADRGRGAGAAQSGAGDEPVEQLVLGPLEPLDLGQHRGAVAAHGLGVAGGLAVLVLGQRGLRHQRPQAGLVGLVGQVGQLLVGHLELAAGLAHALGGLGQAPLEQRPGHGASVGSRPAPRGSRGGAARTGC